MHLPRNRDSTRTARMRGLSPFFLISSIAVSISPSQSCIDSTQVKAYSPEKDSSENEFAFIGR